MINFKQKGSVTEHIEKFQRLNIKVTNILDEHFIYVFIGNLRDNIQHEVLHWDPNHWRMHLGWKEMLKVKIWLWILEVALLTSIKRIMFILLKQLNLHGGHLKNWRKENKKVYALIVTTSTVRDISVVRRNYST